MKGSLQLGEIIGLSTAAHFTSCLGTLRGALDRPLHVLYVGCQYLQTCKEEFAVLCNAGEGTSSGRWEIVASLGEGGYAEVYQVRDTLTAEAPHVRPSTCLRRNAHFTDPN